MDKTAAAHWEKLKNAHAEWRAQMEPLLVLYTKFQDLKEVEKAIPDSFEGILVYTVHVKDKLLKQMTLLQWDINNLMSEPIGVLRKRLLQVCHTLKVKWADNHPFLVNHLMQYCDLLAKDFDMLKTMQMYPFRVTPAKISELKKEQEGSAALDILFKRINVLMEFAFPSTIESQLFVNPPSASDCDGEKKTPTKSRKSGVGLLHEVCKCKDCGVIMYCTSVKEHHCQEDITHPFISDTRYRGQVLAPSQELPHKALAVVDPILVHPAALVNLGLQPFQLAETDRNTVHPVLPISPIPPLAMWMPDSDQTQGQCSLHIYRSCPSPARVVFFRVKRESADTSPLLLDKVCHHLRHRFVRKGQTIALNLGFGNYKLEISQIFPRTEGLPLEDSLSSFWSFVSANSHSCTPGDSRSTDPDSNVAFIHSGTRIKLEDISRSSDPPGIQISELLDVEKQWEAIQPCLDTNRILNALLLGKKSSGKQTFARAVASHLGSRLFSLKGSLTVGKPLDQVDHFFHQVASEAPCVLLLSVPFLKTFDPQSASKVSKYLMDIVMGKGPDRVVVLATAESPPDQVFMGRYRLKVSLDFPLPSLNTRHQLFAKLIPAQLLLPPDHLMRVARMTPGCSFGYLSRLCKMYKINPSIPLERHIEGMTERLHDKYISTPAKMEWSDIAGLDRVKSYLENNVARPFRQGKSRKQGLLLYGPRSCGKTTLASTLAYQMGILLFKVECAILVDKHVGVTEAKIHDLFSRARSCAPSMLLLQDLDTLCPTRNSEASSSEVFIRCVNAFLTELDGFLPLSGVLVVATTSSPQLVDSAILRKGRLGTHLYVPPPDEMARRSLLSAAFDPQVDVSSCVTATDRLSVDQILGLVNEAKGLAGSDLATEEHFRASLDLLKPTPLEDLEIYHIFQQQHRLQPFRQT